MKDAPHFSRWRQTLIAGVRLVADVPVELILLDGGNDRFQVMPIHGGVTGNGGWQTQFRLWLLANARSQSRIQISVPSAKVKASSTSTPRYLTVLSIFVWPSKIWTARRFPVAL